MDMRMPMATTPSSSNENAPTEGMEMSHGDSMSMFFHTQIHTYVLFQSWLLLGPEQMVCACFGSFALAFLYEGFKTLRAAIAQHYSDLAKRQANYKMVSDGNPFPENATIRCRSEFFTKAHLAQSICHLVQVAVGYFLMLIVMTFSVWLFISIVLGFAFGYFAFGWLYPQYVEKAIREDHCL